MAVNLTEKHFEMEEVSTNLLHYPKPSFVNCPLKYEGKRDLKVVNTFLLQIRAYKAVLGISDEDALFSSPIVLESEACTWWGYTKEEVKSWADFKYILQLTFAPKPPSYQIYQDIVRLKQGANEETFKFIINKRYLFSQLPPTHKHTEEQQIDMVFGQLHLKIRKHLSRTEVKTFEDLISKASDIEYMLSEIKFENEAASNTNDSYNMEANQPISVEANAENDDEEAEPTQIKCPGCSAINHISHKMCFQCYKALKYI